MATFAVFMLGLGLGLIVAGLLMILAAPPRPTPTVRAPRSPDYDAAMARVRAHTRSGFRLHG